MTKKMGMASARRNRPQRITVFGRPGSGKSFFAKRLSQRLGLPLYHLDKYYFVSHWLEKERELFLQEQRELVEKESWIIDGNAIRSLEMRYPRSDMVIYFCFPRWLCFLRILKRRFFKDPSILDRAPYCKERVVWGLLEYMWHFERRAAEIVETLRTTYPHVPFYQVRNAQEVRELLAQHFP